MKKIWFSVFCLLMFSTALGNGGPQVLEEDDNDTLVISPSPISDDDVKNLWAIAEQYNLSNQGVASQIRSQIENTVRGWFNDAIGSANQFRERVMQISNDVDEYDFNYFCPPVVVMTPRDAAVGWIIDKAKEQEWLRRLYTDYCPTEPERFLTGISDYLQENEIPLDLRQACIRVRNAAENCDDIDETKCTEIEELVMPKIRAEIDACEANQGWVSANMATTQTSGNGTVYGEAASVAIASVDPCAFAYRHRERAENALRLCNKYIETCVERCDRIDSIVDECERVAANKEQIIANLTARLRNFCVRRDITERINQYVNETVSSAEVIPVIAVTWLNATESDFLYVQSVELIEELEDTKLFRVFISANRLSDLRDEPFVLRAVLDSVVRSLNRARLTYQRISAIAPNITKHLASMEVIRNYIDPIMQPELDNSEDEMETISEEVTSQEDTENVRGPFYAFLRFFGLAAGTETADASFYEQKAQELANTASRLGEIASTTTDDVAAATLLETANELQQKVQEMEQRAEQKRANANGIFSFLFGGG